MKKILLIALLMTITPGLLMCLDKENLKKWQETDLDNLENDSELTKQLALLLWKETRDDSLENDRQLLQNFRLSMWREPKEALRSTASPRILITQQNLQEMLQNAFKMHNS